MSTEQGRSSRTDSIPVHLLAPEAVKSALLIWERDRARSIGEILARLCERQARAIDAEFQDETRLHADSRAGSDSLHTSRPTLSPAMESKSVGNAPHSAAEDRYHVLRSHAKGGLGEVFVARDVELGREVALKEIRCDQAENVASRSRFLREAAITGRLEHPNIVPVYGLGVHPDGRPYYVMRFIRGESLKEAADCYHCTRSPLDGSNGVWTPPTRASGAPADSGRGTLEFRNLLRRFVDACNAIAFAHSKGILHRDLKPANIMLGEFGETLVVDWGLAKRFGSDKAAGPADARTPLSIEDFDGVETLFGGQSGATQVEGSLDVGEPNFADFATRAGTIVGTPTYMSPEQAAGCGDEIGPASDIYSLGATLYFVLTGRPPFAGISTEVIKHVRAGNFDPPALIAATTPLPLDAIVRRAMALRPSDRYSSALALAEDVERYLADEPVSAWQEPASIRFRRRLRKHPRWVAGLAASLLVGGAAAGIGAFALGQKNRALEAANQSELAQRQRAEANERIARTEAATALAVKEFLQDDLFSLAAPENQAAARLRVDPNLRVRDLVLRAAKAIDGRFAGQPLVEAEVRMTLGSTLVRMGEAPLAAQQQEKALAIRTAELGKDHPQTLSCQGSLATVLQALGKTDKAIELRRDVWNAMKSTLGPDDPNTLRSANNYASSLSAAGRFEEVVPLAEETLRLRRQRLGADHPETLRAIANLALIYFKTEKKAKALALREEVHSLTRSKLGPDHPDTLRAMNNLATSYEDAGRTKDAVRLTETAHQRLATTMGADHPDALAVANNLAVSYMREGQLDDAQRLLSQTLAARERRLKASPGDGAEQKYVALTHGQIGEVEQKRGNFGAAVAAYDRALGGFAAAEKQFGLSEAFFKSRQKAFAAERTKCRAAIAKP